MQHLCSVQDGMQTGNTGNTGRVVSLLFRFVASLSTPSGEGRMEFVVGPGLMFHVFHLKSSSPPVFQLPQQTLITQSSPVFPFGFDCVCF